MMKQCVLAVMVYTGLAPSALDLVDAQPTFTLKHGAESGILVVR